MLRTIIKGTPSMSTRVIFQICVAIILIALAFIGIEHANKDYKPEPFIECRVNDTSGNEIGNFAFTDENTETKENLEKYLRYVIKDIPLDVEVGNVECNVTKQ